MVESNNRRYSSSQRDFLQKNIGLRVQLANLPFFVKVLAAFFIVIATLSLRTYLNTWALEGRYILFIAAIMASTWFFGRRAGILSILFSGILIKYYLIEPLYSFRFRNLGSLAIFTIFILMGIIINRLISTMQKALVESEIARHTILKNEKQFRLMVEGIRDYAIYFLNPEGFVASWNEGAERIKGYSKEDVIGKHFSMFYTREEIADRLPWSEIEQARQKGRFESENWRLKKDGSNYWAHYSINSITNEDEKLEGFVTIVQDLTQRMLQEQQKDNFISIASHELKTPITSIKAFTQLMQKKFQKFEDKNSLAYLSRMDAQLNKLTKLIEDLLDVSRITQGRIEYTEDVFKFDNLVDEVVEEVQLTAPEHKIIKQGRASELVLADKYRVSQVLTNLLTNAIKYSPHANKVVVKTSVTKEGILVSVRDYGIGIPKDQQSHIFERFYRVHGEHRESYPGLGLGLFISSEIMKRHGGKLWFDSKDGKGSTFHFLLPITLHEKLIEQDLKSTS